MKRKNAGIGACCGYKIRILICREPKAFARAIGVSLSSLYRYMNGRIPSTEVLLRIAQHARQPMEWFLLPANGGHLMT